MSFLSGQIGMARGTCEQYCFQLSYQTDSSVSRGHWPGKKRHGESFRKISFSLFLFFIAWQNNCIFNKLQLMRTRRAQRKCGGWRKGSLPLKICSSVLKIYTWGRGKITSKINHHHLLFPVYSGNSASESVECLCLEILQVGFPSPCGSNTVSGVHLSGHFCNFQKARILALG